MASATCGRVQAALPLGDVVGLVAGRLLLPHAAEEQLQVVGVGAAVKERGLHAGLPHLGARGLQAERDEAHLVSHNILKPQTAFPILKSIYLTVLSLYPGNHTNKIKSPE